MHTYILTGTTHSQSHIHTHTYIHAYIHTHRYYPFSIPHTHTHTYTYTHTHIHTYIHTHRYHPFSIPGMQWATPIFASNTRYSESMFTVFRGSWWNRKKAYRKDKELLEARTKLESEKTCEAEGNCWFKVCMCLCVCVCVCVYIYIYINTHTL